MCDRINLPKTITDRANTLFKMVHDGKNLKGRANEAIASACLYIACRQEGVPRTFKEIVAVSTVSKKVIYETEDEFRSTFYTCNVILEYSICVIQHLPIYIPGNWSLF